MTAYSDGESLEKVQTLVEFGQRIVANAMFCLWTRKENGSNSISSSWNDGGDGNDDYDERGE